MAEEYTSLRGPIELEDGKLILRIPLDEGGEQLHLVAQGLSVIDGDDLLITIPYWLAEKIGVAEGTEVYVDDRQGKFNITKVEVQ